MFKKREIFKWLILGLEIILGWLMQLNAYANVLNTPDEIKQAIKNSRVFLVRKVVEDKYYLECQSTRPTLTNNDCLVTQQGKVFAGYFIVYALHEHLPATVSRKIKNQILTEARNNLWGYSLISPVDADNTSFAMQAAAMLGLAFDASTLNLFYNPKVNAYATFNTGEKAVPTYLVSPLGNLGIHPEVNANVYNLLNALHLNNKINYNLIGEFQAQAGYWYSYFYPGKYYSTYLTLRLLCAAGKLKKQINRGIQFIFASQNRDGSWGDRGNAYESALALNSLLACGCFKGKKIQQGIHYLLSQQKRGHWTTPNVIWSYIRQTDPLVQWSAYDSEHIITTSLVVRALTDYLNKTRIN